MSHDNGLIILVAMATLGCPLTANAQATYRVYGTVYKDQFHLQTVAGVHMGFEDSNSGNEVISDANGVYSGYVIAGSIITLDPVLGCLEFDSIPLGAIEGTRNRDVYATGANDFYGTTLIGYVQKNTGERLGDVRLKLVGTGDYWSYLQYRWSQDFDGKFTFEVPCGFTGTLSIVKEESDPPYPSDTNIQPATRSVTAIWTPNSQPWTGEAFTVTLPTRTVTGKVIGDNDAPLSAVVVTGLLNNATTDGNGNFTGTVEYGSQPTLHTSPGCFSAEVAFPLPAVTLQPTPLGIVFRATGSPSFALEGTVTSYEDNNPVKGAFISGLASIPQTDINGHYSIPSALTCGYRYSVAPSHPLYTFFPKYVPENGAASGNTVANFVGIPFFSNATNPQTLQLSGSYGTYSWVDYNNDGNIDIYYCNSSTGDKLKQNNGNQPPGQASFTDRTSLLGQGQSSMASAWADYDNDGDFDAYLVRYNQPNRLYRNDVSSFVEMGVNLGVNFSGPGICAAWGDCNNDGFVDLYLGNDGGGNRLFLNDGGSGFVNATPASLLDNGYATAVAWVDYDGDSDVDLYISRLGGNSLFRNDGSLNFVNVTSGPLDGGYITYGFAWGDYDNDGDLDVALGRDSSPNKLLRNDGGGVFYDVPSPTINRIRNTRQLNWVDYDNDVDLDLALVNWGADDEMLINIAPYASAFNVASMPVVGYNSLSTAGAWGDYNRDGKMDSYVLIEGGMTKLLKNAVPEPHHWLQVDLVGVSSNKKGVGARVKVSAGGIVQTRHVGGEGESCQGPLTAHFGLGSLNQVDWVKVKWPGAGSSEQTFAGGLDEKITIHQQTGGGCTKNCPTESALINHDEPLKTAIRVVAPNPFASSAIVHFSTDVPSVPEIRIYDVAGRMVRSETLADHPAGAWQWTWDGRTNDGTQTQSGIYFVHLQAGNKQAVGRLVKVPS